VTVTCAVILACAASAHAGLIPWEPLGSDSWIVIDPGAVKPVIHTANGGDYAMGFDVAAAGNKSRGMNALKFRYGGASTGHLVSQSLTGSFSVENTGNARIFRDVLLLVAIDAAALPADFAMSLGVSGQSAYTFNPAADIGYYDPATYSTGRPSGYYSGTSPKGEPVAYDFSRGIITVFAAQNVNLGPSGGSVTFNYSFTHLPGTAVFSVYGYDADIGWTYHTNRAVVDANQPTAALSTFEVAPEPATLALLALGASCVFARRSRCRARPR
jgi:hypothetical protein